MKECIPFLKPVLRQGTEKRRSTTLRDLGTGQQVWEGWAGADTGGGGGHEIFSLVQGGGHAIFSYP